MLKNNALHSLFQQNTNAPPRSYFWRKNLCPWEGEKKSIYLHRTFKNGEITGGELGGGSMELTS